MMDMINVIIEIMKTSGLIPEEDEDNAKNAVKVIKK
jgi:hypothetical protein